MSLKRPTSGEGTILTNILEPLHTEDFKRGGTQYFVDFDNEHHVKLHGVWDTNIPEKRNKQRGDDEMDDAKAWAQRLFEASSSCYDPHLMADCVDINQAKKCSLKWADDANKFICSYVLADDIENQDVGGAYYDGAWPIVDELIGTAGKRLGAWLNALAAQNAQLVQDGMLVEQSYKSGLKQRRRRGRGFACPSKSPYQRRSMNDRRSLKPFS